VTAHLDGVWDDLQDGRVVLQDGVSPGSQVVCVAPILPGPRVAEL